MAECLQISQNNRNDSNSDTDDDDYEEFCENFTFSVSICNMHIDEKISVCLRDKKKVEIEIFQFILANFIIMLYMQWILCS